MPRSLSQLFYTRIQDEQVDETTPTTPTVITLHKHNQRGRDLADYAQAAAPNGRLLGLESYKGIFVGREIVGYTWFLGPLTTPAPVFFGDALAEIERFLWDEQDRQGAGEISLPFLLGVEQGAIMALAAAAAVPDLLSGVIAIEGIFPIVPGWTPPLAPLDGLPVLILDIEPADGSQNAPSILAGPSLAETLTEWGAIVTRHCIPRGTIPAAEMSTWLSAQPVRHAITPPEETS